MSGQMNLPPEEPEFAPWKVVSLAALAGAWRPRLAQVKGRPGVVAVDGRSASGKSTLAAALSRAVPGSVVVHTDDIAWYQTFFDWVGLVRDGVLVPVHAAQEVYFRPPAWEERGREGAIVVPSGCPLVILEGCGAARHELTPWLDLVVWVQTDVRAARTRGLLRDGGTAETEAFWNAWMAEEEPFFARERPWERADVVAWGTPDLDHDPAVQAVVSAAT